MIELEGHTSHSASSGLAAGWMCHSSQNCPACVHVCVLWLLLSPVWTHVDNVIDRRLSFRPGWAQRKGDSSNKLGCCLDLYFKTFSHEDLSVWKCKIFWTAVGFYQEAQTSVAEKFWQRLMGAKFTICCCHCYVKHNREEKNAILRWGKPLT